MFYYNYQSRDHMALIEKINEYIGSNPTHGFWKIYHSIRNEGLRWNHKRLYKVYLQMKLNIKNRAKRRIPRRIAMPLCIPEYINHTLSADFMSDSLCSGRRFRTLNIIDDYNREALFVDADISIPAYRIVERLSLIIKERGKPCQIRVDNGPEFVSASFVDWFNKHKIAIQYIQPGRPMQNGLIERFNRSYRTEVLDAHIFHSIKQVREITNEWVDYYNYRRPHDSLSYLPPIQYKTQKELTTFVV